MAYASRAGRARVSASKPRAFAVCQRCGFWYNRDQLQNQRAWRGAALLQTWLFVCPRCLDVPQENDRVVALPADPVPVQLPFPEDFSVAQSVMGLAAAAEIDPHTGLAKPLATTAMQTTGLTQLPLQAATLASEAGGGVAMVTTNAASMIMGPASPWGAPQNTGAIIMAPTPSGRPPGYALEAVMPTAQTNGQTVEYGVPLPITSIIADGTPLVRVTCNAPHGLTLNKQIVVRGTLNPLADGAFSATPMTATVFSYGCYSPVERGSLLGPETVIVTAQVGLPRDFPALPQTGLPQSRKTKQAQ
jgi:hypothetical protein